MEVCGKVAAKKECLEHIGRGWTDMRPLSLRRHMEKQTTIDEKGSTCERADHH